MYHFLCIHSTEGFEIRFVFTDIGINPNKAGLFEGSFF